MRTGPELDAPEAADCLSAGATLQVLERRSLPDGTQRARVCYQGEEAATLGWVSAVSKEGTINLLSPLDEQAAALAAHYDASQQRIPKLPVRGSRDTGSSNRSPGRDRAGTDSQVFVVRTALKLRTGYALDSAEVGTLDANLQVRVLDRRELADGTRRARVGSHDEEYAPLGWVSLLGKDAKENLVVEWRK